MVLSEAKIEILNCQKCPCAAERINKRSEENSSKWNKSVNHKLEYFSSLYKQRIWKENMVCINPTVLLIHIIGHEKVKPTNFVYFKSPRDRPWLVLNNLSKVSPLDVELNQDCGLSFLCLIIWIKKTVGYKITLIYRISSNTIRMVNLNILI